ncbi:hypothetical protein D3C81_2080370 [compost metagenome]
MQSAFQLFEAFYVECKDPILGSPLIDIVLTVDQTFAFGYRTDKERMELTADFIRFF